MTDTFHTKEAQKPPHPLPINPFKEARESILDSYTGRSISHHELAKKIGVTKLSLIRLEQGTFVDPLPNVLQWLVDQGFNELALTDGYYGFQYRMRLHHLLYFGTDLEFELSSETHPFEQLRNGVIIGAGPSARIGVNPTQCAKDLCLPQATISHFETKYRQQKSVPKSIINVMPIIGYTDEQITSWINSYEDWRKRRTGRNVISLQPVQS